MSEATASGFDFLQWETDGTGTFDDPNRLNPVYTPGLDETGQIILTLTTYGTSPCGNISSPVYLDIKPVPTTYAGEDHTIQQEESCLVADASATDYVFLESETIISYDTNLQLSKPSEFNPLTGFNNFLILIYKKIILLLPI